MHLSYQEFGNVSFRQCIKPGSVQNIFRFLIGSVWGGFHASTTVVRSQPAAPSSYLTMTICCMPVCQAFSVQVNHRIHKLYGLTLCATPSYHQVWLLYYSSNCTELGASNFVATVWPALISLNTIGINWNREFIPNVFRSGLCASQSSPSSLDSVNQFYMDLALYTASLLWRNKKGHSSDCCIKV